jgi:hypothetical protein
MTDFEELFKRYDPTTASTRIVTEDYAKGFHDGAADAVKRLLKVVNSLDVDSFDDIVYKKDLVEALDKMDKANDE